MCSTDQILVDDGAVPGHRTADLNLCQNLSRDQLIRAQNYVGATGLTISTM